MSSKKKILFITQEILPYVPETTMAKQGRKLPQLVQDAGNEIRTFMPRWGSINERRNQLHEVIRLSGMNIIIDETDHTLIIKVASIQQAHMQVYFIDNEDYFHKRGMLCDKKGVEYGDNIERAVFYARGVLETIKKMGFSPDIIYCQGWISALAPMLIKKAYNDEPVFHNAKVVYSVYGERPQLPAPENIKDILNFHNIDTNFVDDEQIDLSNADGLSRIAVMFSDGIIQGDDGVAPRTMEYANSLKIPVLEYNAEATAETYDDFFENIIGKES